MGDALFSPQRIQRYGGRMYRYSQRVCFSQQKAQMGTKRLFVLLSVGSAALTWKSPMNLLPATASVLSVFSFWRAKPKLSGILAYPISLCMLTYDIFIFSYMGIANEIFTLLSTTVSIAINKKRKSKLDTNNNM